RRNTDPSVPAGVQPAARRGAEVVAATDGVRWAPVEQDHLRRLVHERGTKEAHVDVLAAARPLAGDERGDGGERTEGARAVVVVGDHVQHRGVVPALRRREAGPRLEDGVEAGQRSEGPGRAVAGDRHVHQPRVQARQVIPADPEPVHDTRAEVLDDDVGAADEVEEYLAARCALQVEYQRALAAVPADEAEELEPERIAARRLDLDDVGAELGEQQRTERTRDEIAEVEDTDPLEAGARSVAGRSVRRAR